MPSTKKPSRVQSKVESKKAKPRGASHIVSPVDAMNFMQELDFLLIDLGEHEPDLMAKIRECAGLPVLASQHVSHGFREGRYTWRGLVLALQDWTLKQIGTGPESYAEQRVVSRCNELIVFATTESPINGAMLLHLGAAEARELRATAAKASWPAEVYTILAAARLEAERAAIAPEDPEEPCAKSEWAISNAVALCLIAGHAHPAAASDSLQRQLFEHVVALSTGRAKAVA